MVPTIRRLAMAVAGLVVAVAWIPSAGAAIRVSPGVGCAWGVESDANVFNVAFPDQNATYWGTALLHIPRSGLVVRGAYPRARYFSLIAYDPLLRPVGGLRDDQIDPATGVNPFRPGEQGVGTWKVRILAAAPPAHPAPNTIYAGRTYEGDTNPGGFVLYRVYVPNNQSDPTGGVGLPTVTYAMRGVGSVTMPPCASVANLPNAGVNDQLSQSSYPSVLDGLPAGTRTASNPPGWGKFFGYGSVFGAAGPQAASLAPGGGGFLSNTDNQYITAPIDHAYGNLVVLRAKMPTFPNTTIGQPPWQPGQQVRYWSICENEKYSTRYVACTADFQAVLDSQGRATFVISDPDARPTNATVADGVNWLPWGDYPDGLLIYRQMGAAPSFSQAIANIQQGEPLEPAMGSYLPQIAYCTTAEFERSGADGCLS